MHKSHKRILGALVLGLFLTAPGPAAEKRVRMRDLPEAVQLAVKAQSKGATIRGLSEEIENGKTYYEVEMTVDRHGKDVLMDPSGAVVEIEEEVAWALLPPAVKAEIERNAGAGKVLTVESVTKGNNLVAYEARIQKAGKKSEIQVGPDGKLIRAGKP